MGSGSDEYPELSIPLGQWLATQPVHLLTGGGPGVMHAVSKAFYEAQPRPGLVIGIIPGTMDPPGAGTKSGYPNPFVEIAVRTHLPLSGEQGTWPMSRNHINVLTSDCLIALPGAAGTRSEIELAHRYGKPIVVFESASTPMAGLPDGIQVTRDLEQVKTFVRGLIR
jgi:uncharacterized protein (TIGR00725 family)